MSEGFNDISRPIHYAGNGEVECMDALESMMSVAPAWMSAETAYWWGCVFKYLWRWPHKNRMKDLLKARQCFQYLIKSVRKDFAEDGEGEQE